jgi:hypothetical protein
VRNTWPKARGILFSPGHEALDDFWHKSNWLSLRTGMAGSDGLPW